MSLMQARKLALNIVKIYKRDNNLKKVLSGIMFEYLIFSFEDTDHFG